MPKLYLDRYMKKWMGEWCADPILMGILRSRPLQRLRDISFLGAIDYTALVAGESNEQSNRWEHSLGVATITDFVARERQYDNEKRRHLVAAALLHDIGHAPLSHSVEPYFKRRLGVGHHDLGEYFMEHDKVLSGVLNRHFDLSLIKALIAGKAGQDWGGDLFSSPINVDTIDGILRSMARFGEAPSLDPLTVAHAAFLEPDRAENRTILDQFWSAKGQVYTHYITSTMGVLADSYCQDYFESNQRLLTTDHLMETEQEWRHGFPDLFLTLGTLGAASQSLAREGGASIDYVSRWYFVVPEEEEISARYQVEKTRKKLALSLHDKVVVHQEGGSDGTHRTESRLYH